MPGKFVSYSELKDADWTIWQNEYGNYPAESVNRAIFLDIRNALLSIKNRLDCQDTLQIPGYLRKIAANTALLCSVTKPKPKAKRRK
jgi:hypothetical protein